MTENASTNTQTRHLELKNPGYTLVLLLATDASSCSASYRPSGGGPPISETELSDFLAQAGITTGVREEGVQKLLQQGAEGKPLAGLLLAEGTPPLAGEDGRVALLQDGAPAAPEAPDDLARVVDFHQVQQFLNVQEGEGVAVIVPPGEGTPGLSVLGEPIPPRPGNPAVAKLGKNVRLDEDGAQIVATAAGRVFCQGNEVSVEDVYQVAGDVDFKIGNVDYNGFLEVTGDILDGFKVRASKGIKVLGNVGACTLSSDGDISFCGMNGRGLGVVNCGGSVSANFIYETKMEVKGNVVVESEIRLCGIKCLGSVRVNKGGMVGGECVALAGVDVGALGSVTSLHTRVVVGVNYRDLEELTQRFDELKELTNRQQLAQGSKGDSDLILQERAAVTALIRQIRSRRYDEANPKVNVRKVLFGGVTVNLDTLAEEFREERQGPFSMIENTTEGGVRFLGLTELSMLASVIEANFLRQAEVNAKGDTR